MAGVDLVDTLDEYAAWDQANWDPKDPDDPARSLFPVNGDTNQAGFSGESFAFFNGLKISALALLESDGINDNGTRIAGTQLGGWDTHNGQGQANGRQAELLSWLAYGMRSLRIVLSGAAIEPLDQWPGVQKRDHAQVRHSFVVFCHHAERL